MSSTAPADRVSVFGISVDRVTLKGAASRLADWIDEGQRECRYVVTPNLDHVLLYHENVELRQAYSSASMVVADGWPLVTASRINRQPLPERVAGSDLVPGLFEECQQRELSPSVFLLGAAPGVADRAAMELQRRWPNLRVTGTCSPAPGFEKCEQSTAAIINSVNECSPDILVVGFGAPKQELWLEKNHRQIQAGVALAAGATIDFFGGRQKRAPVWMQKMRLEWTHRLLTNPRRLARRYARNAWMLPGLMLKERLNQLEQVR